MELKRGIFLVLVTAVTLTVTILPCSADEKKDEKDIWVAEETRGPRMMPRPGPGSVGDEPRGPRMGSGRGPGTGRMGPRFELTDEEIDRVMKGLKESNPAKAKDLAKLRETEPEKFIDELRKYGREEFGKIIKERIAKWMSQRREEFLEWLGKVAPNEKKELDNLKGKNPNLYTKKYELTWNKYGRIFEASKRNSELADILLEDMKLQKRRDELVRKIKSTRGEKEKKKLVTEMEKVIAGRFDLIVRRKQIAYERLLKWLEGLQKQIKKSRDEITEYRDDNVKISEVKKRAQDLLGETPVFRWD